ncbi:MAG: hypothetical protein JWQ39_1630 [Glaciihabitans sp.]|jgi:hypothetical protein|nr:hypothetical protein [Glaciihabitans sp.]
MRVSFYVQIAMPRDGCRSATKEEFMRLFNRSALNIYAVPMVLVE